MPLDGVGFVADGDGGPRGADSRKELDDDGVLSLGDYSSSSSGCSSGSEEVEDFFFCDGAAAASAPGSPPRSPLARRRRASGSEAPGFSAAEGGESAGTGCGGLSRLASVAAASHARRPRSEPRIWWGGGLRRGLPVAEVLVRYPERLCGVPLPPLEELKSHWRELGALAFWKLSSAKDGSGVAQLRDNNSRTFWQSDGATPHTATLTFNRLMRISRVDLLLNLHADESYTPRLVQIKIGDTPTSLHVAKEAEYEPRSREEGDAWWTLPLRPKDALRAKYAGRLPFESEPSEELRCFYDWLEQIDYVSGFCLQIAVLHTFHEGRDVHIRQIRIYGLDEGDGARPLLLAGGGQAVVATTEGDLFSSEALASGLSAFPSLTPSQQAFPPRSTRSLGSHDPEGTGDRDEEEGAMSDGERTDAGGEDARREPGDVAAYLMHMYRRAQLTRQRDSEAGGAEPEVDARELRGGEAGLQRVESGVSAPFEAGVASEVEAGKRRALVRLARRVPTIS
ncbi:anaphase-promoting complex subunit APC10 [Besnoitia besnoiti]|uniref:Anaphase-promoting complex subunit APC10 n=1 Tax=Besnoitia besnoiti TaxID=94643 RepID=A0A2A9M967_BESBE|nr:anaphase-promoting complex subunit APC10 [Besnoitia besnoiti]PFH34545.1 anaphase-promoting complex subunit APC10 [Besnoitia besnoiti]